MGWIRTRLIPFLAVILISLSAFAADGPAPAVPGAEVTREGTASTAPIAPIAPQLSPAVALAHRMEALRKALDSGSEAALESAIRDVELLRRTYGTLDLGPLVDALTVWARDASRRGNADAALRAVKVAERWAPNRPEVVGTRITVMRGASLAGFFWSIPEVLKLNSIRLGSDTYRWLWLVQHFAWLRMMATLVLWGWALTLALRYRCVLRHSWEEQLQLREMNPRTIAAVGALILAAPVVLGMDPSVAALAWLILLAPYQWSNEVKVTVLVMALQLAHPALVVLEPLAAAEPPPLVSAIQTQPQVQPLAPEVLEHLSGPDQAFLRGWEQLTLQDWAGAEATFRELQGQHPDQGEVLNNLAVAEFHLDRKADAGKHFDAAQALLRSSPEVLVNQSVLAFEKLDTLTGSAKQDEARKFDPEAFDRLMAVNGVLKAPRTFPVPLPDTPARSRALAAGMGGATVWSSRLQVPAVLLGILVPLGALWLFMRRLKQSVAIAHPTQCVRCGEPFHTTDSPDPNVCPKCHHLFVMRDGLHQESRKKKIDEVGEFQAGQKKIHRLLLIFLPGCDVAFMGDAIEGFIEFGALAFAFGLVVATGRTVRYPGEILPDPASTWMPLGALLLIVLYVRSWMKLLPRRS